MATRNTAAAKAAAEQENVPELKTVPEEKESLDELTALLRKQQEQIAQLQKQSAEVENLKKELAEAKAREQAAAARRGVTDRQVADEAMRKCAEEGIDPWTVTVPVRAKIRRDTNEKQYWGAVNGRTYAVPADDQYHEMKLPFALNLLDTMHVDRFVEKFAEKNIQMYDPKTNPKPED